MLESSSSVVLVLLMPVLICLSNCKKLDFRDKEDIIDGHNYYRSEAAATKMFMMEWDKRLAKLAQKHTNKCVDDYLDRDDIGQNLFVSGKDRFFADAMVDNWIIEKKGYDYDNEKCTSDWHYCENYLQVVWGLTERVGCASTYCPSLPGAARSTLAVCFYSPRGNTSGIKPFKKGVPCSECPPEYRCIRNLCVGSTDENSGQTEKAPFVISIFLFMIFAVLVFNLM